jgi:ADP-ribose diphosphatase
MKPVPEIRQRRTVAETRMVRVEDLKLEFASGAVAHFERVQPTYDRAALIVPLLDRDTVLLVREYAVGLNDWHLAFPKGRIDGDEGLAEAANRELMEEIGYGANSVTRLGAFSALPSVMSHITQIMLAEDLYPQRLQGDEPEEIEVVPWRLDRVDELVGRGDFIEALSIAALYMVRDRMLCQR